MKIIVLLILAIIQVESSDNDLAYNIGSGARGPMQIKNILRIDINQKYGLNYKPEDLHDRKISIRYFHLTMLEYATVEKLGRVPTFRDYVGIWKQGFSGYTKNPKGSDVYWEKVKAKLCKAKLK